MALGVCTCHVSRGGTKTCCAMRSVARRNKAAPATHCFTIFWNISTQLFANTYRTLPTCFAEEEYLPKFVSSGFHVYLIFIRVEYTRWVTKLWLRGGGSCGRACASTASPPSLLGDQLLTCQNMLIRRPVPEAVYQWPCVMFSQKLSGSCIP